MRPAQNAPVKFTNLDAPRKYEHQGVRQWSAMLYHPSLIYFPSRKGEEIKDSPRGRMWLRDILCIQDT